MYLLPKGPKKLVASYSYAATDDDEVDLEVGDEVETVTPDKDGWTLVKKRDGASGLVPTNYLGDA